MKRTFINPNKVVGKGMYDGKCFHPAVERNLLDDDLLYGIHYTCLICGKTCKKGVYIEKEGNCNNPYILKTILYQEEAISIVQEYIKIICEKYKDKKQIDIAKILRKLDVDINSDIKKMYKDNLKLKETHKKVNDLIVELKGNEVLDTKKISDKWHTFSELYMQRLYLFSIICSQNKDIAWKSKKHFDEENDPMFNGDFIVGLDTQEGPASYHFKMEFWDMFDVKEIKQAPKYDGYTQEEASKRLLSIVKNNQLTK